MNDHHARSMDLNDLWNAVVRGDEPADQWADSDEDRALVRSLQQAVAMNYPVPDTRGAWARVMERHAHPESPASAPTELFDDIPRMLPAALAAHLAAAPVRRRSPGRSVVLVVGVIALAAVMVLGLLGSLRGLVAWPLSRSQAVGTLTTFPAISSDSDQEVLALNPEVLLAHLGSGWSLRSAVAEVEDVLAPVFDGFLGSTRLVFGGPDGALIIVVVQPVAADPSSMAAAWVTTSSDALREQGRLDPETRSREPAGVAGCRQAIHLEGHSKADPTSAVGITQCSVDTSEIVLFTTSGEILGNEGWAASDQLATFIATELADAPIVPTHRFAGRGPTEGGLYRDALVDAPLVRSLSQGTLLRWTGDVASSPDTGSKTPWLKMRTAEGAEGWVPGDFLFPQVEGWLPEGYQSATPAPD